MQKRLVFLLIHVLACGALTSIAAPARADVQLAGDLDYVLPLDSDAESGGGFAVRLGWELRLPLVALTPEAAFSYAGFTGTYGPGVYRPLVGVRLGFGEVFRLGAFGHFGFGHLSADVPGPDPTHTAFTYDLGLFLDFTLLPLLNLGVHGAYDRLAASDDDPAFEWLTFGAHAALIL